MSFFLKLVYINDIVIPIVAILCNILLLWLIKTVKTKTLIHINYSLVPHCILDIAVSIVTFIVAPHLFHVGGFIYMVFGDLFGSFGFVDRNSACYLISFYSALAITSMISITASFCIRYLVICKDQTITSKTMILPLFLVLIAFLSLYISCFWAFKITMQEDGYFESSILTRFWYEEYGRYPILVANRILSIQFFCFSGFLLILFTLAYGLIFYFSYQISKTLMTHIDNVNSGTKLIHKQVQRTLCIQAIAPSLIGSFPLSISMILSFFVIKTLNIALVLSIFPPWASLCNPIAAMIFIKLLNHIEITSMKLSLNLFLKEKMRRLFPEFCLHKLAQIIVP